MCEKIQKNVIRLKRRGYAILNLKLSWNFPAVEQCPHLYSRNGGLSDESTDHKKEINFIWTKNQCKLSPERYITFVFRALIGKIACKAEGLRAKHSGDVCRLECA